jgi:hypothetical protein
MNKDLIPYNIKSKNEKNQKHTNDREEEEKEISPTRKTIELNLNKESSNKLDGSSNMNFREERNFSSTMNKDLSHGHGYIFMGFLFLMDLFSKDEIELSNIRHAIDEYGQSVTIVPNTEPIKKDQR